MGVSPIDMQVIIAQMNQVGESEQQMENVANIQQQHYGNVMEQQAIRESKEVVQTHQPENSESKVNPDAENPGEEYRSAEKKEQKKSDKKKTGDKDNGLDIDLTIETGLSMVNAMINKELAGYTGQDDIRVKLSGYVEILNSMSSNILDIMMDIKHDDIQEELKTGTNG